MERFVRSKDAAMLHNEYRVLATLLGRLPYPPALTDSYLRRAATETPEVVAHGLEPLAQTIGTTSPGRRGLRIRDVGVARRPANRGGLGKVRGDDRRARSAQRRFNLCRACGKGRLHCEANNQ